MLNYSDTLINGSSMDDNKKIQAKNALTNAKSQADWDKIINRLLQLQTTPV
jgi:hypothetical protein